MKNKFLMSVGLSTLMTLSVAACTSAPPMSMTQPDLTFAQLQPVSLNVAKIEVYDEYRQPASGGHIEHEFQTPPAVAAKNLIENKLRADGARQVLRVFIDDASVVAEKLAVRDDFFGNFTREPSERYRGRIALRFELVNEEAPEIIVGRASVVSDRTRTVMEDISLADRDRAHLTLTEELSNDLYAGFQTIVQTTFGFK